MAHPIVCFSDRMQRILKYCNIQYIILTSDSELNIAVYRTPSYVII